MVAEQDGTCAAKAPTHQIAGVADAIEDKDQLSNTDAHVECIVEKIIDDHVLRVTDNAVEGVKCSAQERVQSYTVEQSVDVQVTRRCAFTMDDGDELIPEWLSFVKGVVESEDILLNIFRETLLENKILRVIGKNLAKKCLEFIKGVVDSEDPPLNISGETLRQNKILHAIKKKRVTKYLEILCEITDLNDDFKKSYEQSGERLKLGNDEDSAVGVKTAEVLRFKPGDERNNFDGHVDHMTEGQNDISYNTSESIAVVSSLFEENLRKKGHEVPYMSDPVNECAVHQFKEFGGRMLKSTTKERSDLGDEDEKKTLEELNTEPKPLMKLMKHTLADKIEAVTVSDRIVDSPCVPTMSEYGWSAKMGRIMETQGLRDNLMTSHMVSKKTTEVNPTRSIMMELKSRHDLHDHLQQQQQRECSKPQPTKKSTRQERGGERKEEERDQEGRKEEERKVEERGRQVEEDVAGWTEVNRKKWKKMVQIFVKVNGSKTSPMEVSLTDDRVEDVMRRIQKGEDVYVTMHGKVLRRDEKLKSCEVTDGCAQWRSRAGCEAEEESTEKRRKTRQRRGAEWKPEED